MKHKYKYYRGKDRRILQAALRDRGFRSTEGRLVLLSIIRRAREPLLVGQIMKELNNDLDEVNVYRALEAFCRKGLLTRSDLRRGGARYEYAHRHHHHLICDDCGLTEDVKHCADKHMETRALRNSRSFATIHTHALEFFGLCKSCTPAP